MGRADDMETPKNESITKEVECCKVMLINWRICMEDVELAFMIKQNMTFKGL